jgi:tellurite resistance protein TerC
MGLRAMFFLLENIIDRFYYLKYGLGLVLSFVGVKMLLAEGFGSWLPAYHIPIGWSLGGVAVLLIGSIVISLMLPPPKK